MLNGILSGPEIPLALKIIYTVFVCVLVPIYWRHYGVANFLWFSDLALLLTVVALWLENRMIASMETISVLMLELVWIADFLFRLIFGTQVIGISEYMFKADQPLFVRGLSLFHLFLPFLLLWLVYVLGYDERAWVVQTVFFWLVMVVCFFFTRPSENINWVFGPGNQPQQKIAPGLYLALVLIAVPISVYLPTHLLLRKIVPK